MVGVNAGQALEGVDHRIAQKLRARAAAHLGNTGADEEAVLLYWEAGRTQEAVALAEKASRDGVKNGRSRTLKRWVAFADEARLPAVELRAAFIECLAVTDDVRKARQYIRQVLKCYRNNMSRIDRLGFEAWGAWAGSHVGDSRRAARKALGILARAGNGDNHRAGRLAHAAIAFSFFSAEGRLPEAQAHAQAAIRAAKAKRSETGRVYMEMLLGNILDAQGKTEEGKESDHRLMAAISGWKGIEGTLAEQVLAIWAHREMRWDEALRHYRSLRQQEGLLGLSAERSEGSYGLSEVYSNLGLFQEAAGGFERALSWFSHDRYKWRLLQAYVSLSRAWRLTGEVGRSREWLARARSLPRPYRTSSQIVAEELALEVAEGSRTVNGSLLALVRRIRRGSGVACVESRATFALARYCWAAGRLDLAEVYSINAIELADKTKYLHYLCGELAGSPDFQAFLAKRLPLGESVRRLWEALEAAKKAAAILQAQGEVGELGRRVVIRSLGVEGILAYGREIYLKPLFAELLFYLLDKKTVNQEELFETFWPAKAQEKQRANAHAAMYSIRKSLGQDAVLIRGESMSIGETIAGTGDAEGFERMARRELSALKAGYARLERCEVAIALYRGPFLPGRSRQWVLDRRRMLEAIFRQLVLAYASECSRVGRGEEALPAVARALGYDPLDEGLAIMAAEIYAEIGRRAIALHTLSSFRSLLKKELGLDPSEEFIELEIALSRSSAGELEENPGVMARLLQ